MEHVFIISEVGSNHQGSLSLARAYVEQAKLVGADAVKFQLIRPFRPEWIDPLIEECSRIDIEFMATPFNQAGIDALKGKVKHWKISSTEAANKRFVAEVENAADGSPIFISDGSMTHVEQEENFVPLACIVKYPATILDYTFDIYRHGKHPWGLSDHTQAGSWLPYLAVAAGATVVEKHLTLNKKWQGPDHNFALEPDEFKIMVENIRVVEKLLTNKKTTITDYVGRKIEWP